MTRLRARLGPRPTGKDAMAGLVVGVESVPDGLASGLLAGVNPVAGLYGGMFGMFGAALFTGTTVMAVQATGAMSIIIADVDLASRGDPARALYTLTILTGLIMLVFGLLKLGSFLRFVSNSVMTGFVTAVGANIVLGQLDDFTGYDSQGSNRILQALDLLLHLGRVHWPTLAVGLATVALIVVLERTRLGSLGLVVAVFAGSILAAFLTAPLAADDVSIALVQDVAEVPRSLPTPQLPVLRDVPFLILPAASLAFVGLVQGAGVSSAHTTGGDTVATASQDFVAQGAGNVLAGVFRGMPVGGSMSASALTVEAGGKNRSALLIGAAVMAIVIVVFGTVIERIAMPSLAALLMVVGVSTIKPSRVAAVARTGPVPLSVMSVTLVLTMLIPLQYSVLVGVGISVLMVVAGQSSRLVTRRLVIQDDGRVHETDVPAELGGGEVVVLQPYGAIFFATAATLHQQMPTVTSSSRHSVVILRIRGADATGSTLLEVLAGYARSLHQVNSKLVLVTNNTHLLRQLEESGTSRIIGHDNVHLGTSYLGEAVRAAHDDALAWIESRSDSEGPG